MIVVHPYKSYVLMETVFDAQNDGKASRERLKGSHMEVMKALVRLLKKEIGNYQIFGRKAGPDGYHLRSLRTNSVQLAKMLKCSIRTVRNRLSRLQAAGWIKKIFHGSNAAFEIHVNTDLLHLQETTADHVNSVSGIFANPLPSMRQFLPHTLSQVPRDTNNNNELSGLPSEPSATTSAASPADTQQQTDTATGYHPSSENHASQGQGTNPPKSSAKRVPVRRKPPPKRPETMEEAIAHLDSRDQVRLPRLIDTVWEYALAELDDWMPPYLAPSEVRKGRIGLAEFFAYGNPKRWKDAAVQFIARIDVARGHMERRTAAGKNAFIRLPSYYFDIRNVDGFRITQDWYLENKRELKKAAIRAEIERCLKLYWRELERNEGDIDEAIRVIKQRLEKKGGPKLFQLFKNRLQTAMTTNVNVA
ncbi:MAG: hypothetical protein AAF840_01895 [Bacteroidota bacterium]